MRDEWSWSSGPREEDDAWTAVLSFILGILSAVGALCLCRALGVW